MNREAEIIEKLNQIGLQNAVLAAAMRAIVSTSNNKDEIRMVFNQIIVATQSQYSVLQAGEHYLDALRKLSEDLFSPPLEL
jgi:hypothetical protein